MADTNKSDKDVVTSSFNGDGSADFGHFSWHSKTTRYAVLLGFLVLFVLIGVGIYWQHIQNAKPACDQAILTEARDALKPENSLKLPAVANKIMKLKNFDKDQNCLDIVTINYVEHSDLSNAKLYLSKLEKIKDPQKAYSPILGSYAQPTDQLKTEVDFLIIQQKEFQANTFHSSGTIRKSK